MITPDLLDFIRTERAALMSDKDIESLLVTQGGWTTEDVREAFLELNTTTPNLPPETEKKEEPEGMRAASEVMPSTPPLPELEMTTAPLSATPSAPPLAHATPATEAPLSPPSVTPTPPIEPPSLPPVSPEEDFLGIFSSPTADFPVATATASSDGVRAVEIRHAMNMPNPTPVRSQEAQMGDALSGHPSPAPSVSPAVSQIKFDLGKIRVASSISDKAETSAPPQERPSLSSLLSEASKESTPLSTPKAPHSSSLSMKRTMASDLLLHGTPQDAPVSTPAVTPTRTSVEALATPPSTSPSLTSHASTTRPTSILLKKILTATLGIALCATIGVGGYLAVTKFNLFGGGQQFASAIQAFLDASSMSYVLKGAVDMTLDNGGDTSQVVKFTVGSTGSTEHTDTGFGNGTHRLTIEGKLASGNFALPTKVEADLHVVGSQLYFHLLSFPPGSELPVDVFEKFWIKVDLAEIAKELALTALNPTDEAYGAFAGSSGVSFLALLKQHQPIVLGGEEPDDGSTKKRISFTLAPEAALEVVLAMRETYLRDAGTLSEDGRARLLVALSKLGGVIEIDSITGALTAFSVRANLDDEVFGTRVKGTMNMEFAFSGLGASVVVEQPSSILTLEELRVEMETHQARVTALREDEVRVMRLSQVLASLQAYGASKGRYPTLLSELYDAGLLSSSTIPQFVLNSYAYAAYQDISTLSRSNRCTTKGKVCDVVHVGLNIVSLDPKFLGVDADMNSEIRGSDEAGCTNEKDVACYDIVLERGAPESVSIEATP